MRALERGAPGGHPAVESARRSALGPRSKKVSPGSVRGRPSTSDGLALDVAVGGGAARRDRPRREIRRSRGGPSSPRGRRSVVDAPTSPCTAATITRTTVVGPPLSPDLEIGACKQAAGFSIGRGLAREPARSLGYGRKWSGRELTNQKSTSMTRVSGICRRGASRG